MGVFCYHKVMSLTDQKYYQKQQTLFERTMRALGATEDEAKRLLSIGRQQSIRINTLRAEVDGTLRSLRSIGVDAHTIPWMDNGVYVDGNLTAARDSTLADEGKIYIQNAASWLPVLALNPQPGQTILDMCAAPGGKTSHIAQAVRNQAVIYANDNSRPRLHKLQGNLSRLGVENVTFTLHDATRISSQFDVEYFDKILLDAPCSGEGMMTLDNRKDFESWSVAHIKRLQQLQKKLIVQAWRLLKPGGTLVYSTCTMAPEENEAVIDYLLRHNDDVKVEALSELGDALTNKAAPVLSWNDKQFDERISRALRLIPSPQVEAFFVIKLTKMAE